MLVYLLLFGINHPFCELIDYKVRKSLLRILSWPSDLAIKDKAGDLANVTPHFGVECEPSFYPPTTLLVDCIPT